MLDDFGCYPVCIEIDFDSYGGPWTHVSRFRRRSGWLLVARASILVKQQEVGSYPVVVGVDEYDEAIPAFMASNILACACSHPQLCHERPPDELEGQLEEQRAAVRNMWLRDTYSEFAALDEQANHDLEELDGSVAAKVKTADAQIADIRRRRRMLDIHDPARAVFDSVVAEIESYQQSMLEWSATRREEIRAHYEAKQKEMSRQIRPYVDIETLYVVNWFDGDRSPQYEIEHTGIYSRSIEYHRSIIRSVIPPEISSIDGQLAALRKGLTSFYVRDEIKRLNKFKKRLIAQLEGARGN